MVTVTQLETCSGTCHARMSNCSLLFRIYLLPLWVKSNTSSSCEVSLYISGFPQHLASSPKSSPWPQPQGAASLPPPRPRLDPSPASRPGASFLLLEYIKPAPTSGLFIGCSFCLEHFIPSSCLLHSFISLLTSLERPSLTTLPKMSALSQHPLNSITISLSFFQLPALTATDHTLICLFFTPG